LLAAAIPFLRTFGLPRGWTLRLSEVYALARRNAPLAAADAIEWGSRRLDIAILALFVSPSTVGIYWVAQQIASLPQKLKTSFDPVLGPAIVRLLDAGDRAGVARQISQAGFWILAAQAGVALALAIPGEALMDLIGKGKTLVGGNGALALLLAAEVVAALAVVSEAALVYVARHRNMLISLGMIGVQALLSVGFILLLRAQGYGEAWQAAGVAVALLVSLALGSIIKSRLAARLLQGPVSVWRWPILWAVGAVVLAGQAFIRLPQWMELAIGIPAMLALYGWIVWTRCFGENDRVLFKRIKG
jgi:O-antigen/teichoic acid export membrane protein